MKCETVLTKDYSNMMKGVAVLLMIIHHTWGFPCRIPELHILHMEEQIGIASKICVSIFMFLSGYGLYYTFNRNSSIHLVKRLKAIYERFWKVFFVFVPLGFLFFDRTFRLQEFLLNLFCVDYSYNREWWFMGTYIELLLVLPLVLRLDTKKYFLVAVLLVAIALRFLSGFFELNSGGANSHIHQFGYYFPVFYLGLFFSKYSLFERFQRITCNRLIGCVVCVIMTVVAFVIRSKWDITEMTILMTPLFIYLFVVFFRLIGNVNKVFLLFGKHSMNMWLIHSFFCYYYFQKEMLMISDNAIVAYVLLVVMSLLSSMVIDLIWRHTHNVLIFLSKK